MRTRHGAMVNTSWTVVDMGKRPCMVGSTSAPSWENDRHFEGGLLESEGGKPLLYIDF